MKIWIISREFWYFSLNLLVQFLRDLDTEISQKKIPWAHVDSPTILGMKVDTDRCEIEIILTTLKDDLSYLDI